MNFRDDFCGSGGAECADCRPSAGTCEPTTGTCHSWKRPFSEPQRYALLAVCSAGVNEAVFGSNNQTLVWMRGSTPQWGLYAGMTTQACLIDGPSTAPTVYTVGTWGNQPVTRVFTGQWDGGDGPGVREFLTGDVLLTVFKAGNDIFTGGDDFNSPIFYVRDGGGWSSVPVPGLVGTIYDGVGAGPGDYYVLTVGQLAHRVGTTFDIIPLPRAALTVARTDAGTLWIGGDGLFARVVGQVPTYFDAGTDVLLWGSWAWDDNNVFMVGLDQTAGCGMVLRFNGTSFKRSCISPKTLAGIDGTSISDLWASDNDGGVWHYTP